MFLARKGGMTYVARGDPAADDWTQATLTLDSAWHDLDLTAIVPAAAKAVILRLTLTATLVNARLSVRPQGSANAYTYDDLHVPVAGNLVFKTSLVTFINGKINYRCTTVTGYNCGITVLGWFL